MKVDWDNLKKKKKKINSSWKLVGCNPPWNNKVPQLFWKDVIYILDTFQFSGIMDTWITPDELYEAIVFFFCCFFFQFFKQAPIDFS